jgi:hypothetical protein
MPAAPTPTDLFTIARPFLWLAALAFVTGFLGDLALGHSDLAAAQVRAQPASIHAPGADAWNLPKHI